MPTLQELKDMLIKAEHEAVAGIEHALGLETEDLVPAATAVAVETPAEKAAAADPVWSSETPYGIVDGVPGVKYQQHGAYFSSQFKFVSKE